MGTVAASSKTITKQAVPQAAASVRAGHRQSQAVAGLHEHLDRKLAELPPLSELFVIDAGGTVVASTVHSAVGEDWSDSELFRVGSRDRFFSDDLEALGGLVGPVYRLAVPIRAPSGRSAVISVWMNPGATALAVTPRAASSRATERVNPRTPALLAA